MTEICRAENEPGLGGVKCFLVEFGWPILTFGSIKKEKNLKTAQELPMRRISK